MQSQLGKACTTKNNVFIRLFSYVVLMRLQQNRKPGQRTIIFFELSVTFLKLQIRFVFYVREKSYTSSVSGKHFVPYRNSWMRKTSMHSIRVLTVHVRRPVKIHNNKEISNKTWEDSSGSFRVNTGFYNSFHPCYYDNALNMKGKRSWKF